MPTDPTDTPESLRALAQGLRPQQGHYSCNCDRMDAIVDALHRAADRLEVPSNAADLVRAIAAARRAGAEEMRAKAAEKASGMLVRDLTYPGAPLRKATEAEIASAAPAFPPEADHG